MERVSIVCATSHAALFDLVAPAGAWKEDVRAPKDAAALMHFFAQFAKDCQGGGQTRTGGTQGTGAAAAGAGSLLTNSLLLLALRGAAGGV